MKLIDFLAVACVVIVTETYTVHGSMSMSIPNGCFKNGQIFSVGDIISSGQDGNWCFGSICGDSGHVLEWDNFNCGSTTSTTYQSTTNSPSTTFSSSPSPTTPNLEGCFHNGKIYSPGAEIEKGEDRNSNWCHGIICSDSGQVLYWDDFNCFTTPSTTSSTTSSTPTTTVTLTSTTTSSMEEKPCRKKCLSKLWNLLMKKLRPK